MARKSKTKLSFQVTFEAPPGFKIPEVRDAIKRALANEQYLELKGSTDLKVHLVNKETTYG